LRIRSDSDAFFQRTLDQQAQGTSITIILVCQKSRKGKKQQKNKQRQNEET